MLLHVYSLLYGCGNFQHSYEFHEQSDLSQAIHDVRRCVRVVEDVSRLVWLLVKHVW